MTSGANEYVHIMGTLGENPYVASGNVTPPLPGTSSAPPGTPSSLSPAELAHMQQINTAADIQSAKSNTMLHTAVAIGAVLLLGAGVAYAVHK